VQTGRRGRSRLVGNHQSFRPRATCSCLRGCRGRRLQDPFLCGGFLSGFSFPTDGSMTLTGLLFHRLLPFDSAVEGSGHSATLANQRREFSPCDHSARPIICPGALGADGGITLALGRLQSLTRNPSLDYFKPVACKTLKPVAQNLFL